jgi:hypothetical protein
MYLFSAGDAEVVAITSPTLNFDPTRGLALAVSFDSAPPQTVTLVPKGYDIANRQYSRDWENSVKDNARTVKTKLTVDKAGYHTLKVWMVDPGVVLQKLVVDLGGMKTTYLGPPESYYGGKTAESKH